MSGQLHEEPRDPVGLLVWAGRLVRRFPALLGVFVVGGAASGLVDLVFGGSVERPLRAGAVAVVGLVVLAASMGVAYRTVAVASDGRAPDFREVAWDGTRLVPALLVVQFAVGMLLVVGALVVSIVGGVVHPVLGLLLSFVAAAFVVVWTVLAVPAVAVDGDGVVVALESGWTAGRQNQAVVLLTVVVLGVPVGLLRWLQSGSYGWEFAAIAVAIGLVSGYGQLVLAKLYLRVR